MNKMLQTLFSRTFIILTLSVAFFYTGSASDAVLYAGVKKTRYDTKKGKKKLEGKYNQLKQDCYYTKEYCIQYIADVIELNKKLELRVIELENLCLVQSHQLVHIRDYLYQKELDPTYCPFDKIKNFFEDPIYLNGPPVDRHSQDEETGL